MLMPKIAIYNIEDDKTIVRDMSNDEFAQYQKDMDEITIYKNKLQEEEALKLSARQKLINGEPLTPAEAEKIVI